MKPSTELFVVDTSPTTALALGAHRPTEESTYVLCRCAGELGADFGGRVLKRAGQIRKHRSIGSLWYVLGREEALEASASLQLLHSLVPLLEEGARLTVASPKSCGRLVCGWLDALMAQRGAEVDLRVLFFPDPKELRKDLRRAGVPLASLQPTAPPLDPARLGPEGAQLNQLNQLNQKCA